ncbi:MAG: HAMP domain-containing sensor histidine kinase, partial [Sulfurimonas sp.]
MYSVDTSFKLLQHLAETIDTFYSFLSQQNNARMSFEVAEELEKVRKITEYSFQNSNISLTFELEVNPTIQGNANEFAHAMLNIILNAKDAFDGASVISPQIKVHVGEGDQKCVISISDNAEGIRLNPIEMVFDLHISTKESGSGLGLFMTKNIIENRFGGKISAENINQGAC